MKKSRLPSFDLQPLKLGEKKNEAVENHGFIFISLPGQAKTEWEQRVAIAAAHWQLIRT